MSTQSAERILLWAAIEDYTPLWEASWELNGAWPGSVPEHNEIVARDALKALLRRGWIRLYRSIQYDGDPIEVPLEDSEALLADSTHWSPVGERQEAIRFGATLLGERAYRTL